MDLKDYKNAIKYYKKELENYEENPAEVLSIGLLIESPTFVDN
jgi:hypothetical protein